MRLPPQPSLLQVLTMFPYNIIILAAGATILVGGVVIMSQKNKRPKLSAQTVKDELELEDIDDNTPLQYETYKEGIVKLFNRFYKKNLRRYKEVTESMTPREFQNVIFRRIPSSGSQALDYLVTAFEIADYSISKPTKEMFDKCQKAVDIIEGLILNE